MSDFKLIPKTDEQKKESGDSKPIKASEAIFDDGSDDFVEVDKPEEDCKTTPDKEPLATEFASSLMTPDKEDTGGTEPLRKSLDGLSPSQDAKVGTLKQMFQDYDQEILCSILFEQCNGNLDASIETILKMQSGDGTEETKKVDDEKPEESSLIVNEVGPSEDATQEKEQPSASIDKATQELIDEMLAEEQQAIMQEEDEQEEAEAAEMLERQKQQRLEQLMLEQDFEMNRKKILAKRAERLRAQGFEADEDSVDSIDEEKDMLDQLKSKFNSQMANFKTKWGNSDTEKEMARMKRLQNKEYLEVQRMKTSSQKRESIKDQAMSDNGMIEEYTFTLPLKVKNTLTGSTHSSSLDNDADDDDERILSARSKARINGRIQVHSLKVQKKNQQISLKKDSVVSYNYDDELNDENDFGYGDQKPMQEQFHEATKEFGQNMQDFKSSTSKNVKDFKTNMHFQKLEAQKQAREKKEAAQKKMDEIKNKMKAKMGSFF